MSFLAEQIIQDLQKNLPHYLNQYDRDRSGAINRNELIHMILQSGCGRINWCTASNMVSEIFCKLDQNHDCQLSVQEIEGNCRCIEKYVSSLRLISPANGAVFCHYPRTTTLTWTPVACAAHYEVEVEFENCGCWYPLIRTTDACNRFTFDFVGAQRGRWRITAHSLQEQNSAQSEWRVFTYRV